MATHSHAQAGAQSSIPPGRAFGQAAGRTSSIASNPARPSVASPGTTPTSANFPNTAVSPSAFTTSPHRPSLNRQRSQSSASASGAASAAAERAQQWLSALAPRGEGRGREFISNTLSGVANVASTVGQEVNGLIGGQRPGHSRPNSISATSPPPDSPGTLAAHGAAGGPGQQWPAVRNRNSIVRSPSPTQSNGDAPAPRRPAAPSNARRLGPPTSNDAAASTSPAGSNRASSPLQPPEPQHRTSWSNAPTELAPDRGGVPRRHSTTNVHLRTGSHSAGTSGGYGNSPGPPSASSSTHGAVGGVAGGRVRHAGMPYKIGFQPSGVKVDRTAEFVEERKSRGAERDKEEGRLSRRWAKIVDLHFNPAMQVPPGGMPRSSSSSFSLSSMASGAAAGVAGVKSRANRRSLMGDALDSMKPGQVWKGIKKATGPGPEEARKRAAEQTIVKWEDDADVKRCRICEASFTLSTRKHHCRLCGRIVCSLPPTPPALLSVQMQITPPSEDDPNGLPPGTRREKCSLLLVADWKTLRGEEVDEGFVGWMSLDQAADDHASTTSGSHGGDTSPIRRAKRLPLPSNGVVGRERSSSILSDTPENGDGRTTPLPQQPMEVAVKGVRCCRECWSVVSRKQIMAERSRVSAFARLYAALRSTQDEIDSLLPQLDEQVAAAARKPDATEVPPSLLRTHKSLMSLLGGYDALAKRLAALPAPEGGSQATVQGALARSAAEFLAKAITAAQAVPKLQRAAAAAKAKNLVVVETKLPDALRAEGVREEKAEDVARLLQPLLEQQAQLEEFIAEANAQRKYDDGRSLAAALAELELEIGRLTASAL